MTSFLEKLNGKLNGRGKPVVVPTESKPGAPAAAAGAPAAPAEEQFSEELEPLDVDIYQSPSEVVIYAHASGVDPNGFEVVLDEENDLLTIRGSRSRPDERFKKASEAKEPEGKYIQQECEWKPFMRKLILPAEVDVVKAKAVFKKGVLVISLPVLKVAAGRKLSVVEMLSAENQPKES